MTLSMPAISLLPTSRSYGATSSATPLVAHSGRTNSSGSPIIRAPSQVAGAETGVVHLPTLAVRKATSIRRASPSQLMDLTGPRFCSNAWVMA